MLDIVLNILAIIGIILLILLAVLLVVLLLVLFFPITYRAYGNKYPEKLAAWVKANWLFGVLRVRFYYPEPGNLTVKLLWFTLFDTAHPKEAQPKEQDGAKSVTGALSESTVSEQDMNKEHKETSLVTDGADTGTTMSGGTDNHASRQEQATSSTEDIDAQKKGLKHWFSSRYEKIRYTIQKIYDKIKHIWENIIFYKRLLQDEQTVALVRHACFRLGRILKSIRPRKIKGELLFGTGAPDTTGYAFGIYGMLLPWLGKHINVTPDFTQSILEGDLYVAGHITVFQLLRHTLMVLLDKRLRLLIHRLKTHKI